MVAGLVNEHSYMMMQESMYSLRDTFLAVPRHQERRVLKRRQGGLPHDLAGFEFY